MRPSRLALVGPAFALALAIPGSLPASYAAPAQRLVVTTEAFFGPQVFLMDERGRVNARVGVEPGLNGGIAVSRRGTAFAFVQTLSFLSPVELPPRIRKRFARVPESTLGFGSFLRDVVVPGISSFSFTVSTPPVAAASGRPAWSPSGRRIVFARARAGRVHLYSARLGVASPPRQLTRSPGHDLNPRWSSDGRMVVFERHVAGETDLYAIRPDSSGLRRLTYWAGHELQPDFSPDGRSLVFSSNLTRRFQLYVMPLDGSFPRRLTSGHGNDRRPVWSPDGRWIAYSSDRDGDDDVYLIDPTGEHERKLTDNASQDLVQDWQPLRDARPPVVRALPGRGPRGRAVELRFSLREGSPRALVVTEIEFRSEGIGVSSVSSGDLGRRIVRTSPRRVHVLRIPYRELVPFRFEDDPEAETPSRFRFCMVAVDPWGNGSRRSCSTFRFTE